MIVAFDYDGTLVDSYSVIEEAFRRAIEKHYPWVPAKEALSRFLTRVELYFERPRFGRHSGRTKQPVVFRLPLFRTWFEERAKLTKPLDDSVELIKKLKEDGHTVISFSAEDFVDGMKEHRLRINGFYDLFDDVIIFGREMTLEEAFALVRERYGDETFVWVDDKPWRFIGRGDENTEYVWYYFPPTARYAREEILARIPRLHVIRDLWSLLDVLERVKKV